MNSRLGFPCEQVLEGAVVHILPFSHLTAGDHCRVPVCGSALEEMKTRKTNEQTLFKLQDLEFSLF